LKDQREIKGLLDGQDRLLDGSHQRDLQAERAERERRRALW
jgi:hypothetical protein